HLVAGNNEIISFSQVYTTKSNATRAVTSCVKAVTTYLDKLEANTTGARVSIEQGSTNQFRFNVFASNGQVVLSSESYTTAAAAWNGAFAVQDAATLDASFAIKTSADNRFYFTLTAQNGQIVGISQMYTTQASAQAGIASVKATLAKLDII
ncbi:MAG TPA: YegP family protein, partial [Kofleriaceae bacterium]|nr:YegP family protein [Kofleriaceae bacterium]